MAEAEVIAAGAAMAEAAAEMVAEAAAGTDRVDVAMSEHLPGSNVGG
jgi:hypothetical protein